ncbi:MAG: hypothetical protein RQ748_11560, partial [Elusimicrobiales bacterium]|nr:hypothetical protein [Elusimicrobiales bacterium]
MRKIAQKKIIIKAAGSALPAGIRYIDVPAGKNQIGIPDVVLHGDLTVAKGITVKTAGEIPEGISPLKLVPDAAFRKRRDGSRGLGRHRRQRLFLNRGRRLRFRFGGFPDRSRCLGRRCGFRDNRGGRLTFSLQRRNLGALQETRKEKGQQH